MFLAAMQHQRPAEQQRARMPMAHDGRISESFSFAPWPKIRGKPVPTVCLAMKGQCGSRTRQMTAHTPPRHDTATSPRGPQLPAAAGAQRRDERGCSLTALASHCRLESQVSARPGAGPQDGGLAAGGGRAVAGAAGGRPGPAAAPLGGWRHGRCAANREPRRAPEGSGQAAHVVRAGARDPPQRRSSGHGSAATAPGPPAAQAGHARDAPPDFRRRGVCANRPRRSGSRRTGASACAAAGAYTGG
eukprot:COSAG04_NODE_5031_length_1774_cov_7.260896_2_plen_246_part_00